MTSPAQEDQGVRNRNAENHAQLLAGAAGEGARLTLDLWPDVGQMLGLTRNATYAAAKRGDIPVIRFGKLMKVPKAALERMLAIPEHVSAL